MVLVINQLIKEFLRFQQTNEIIEIYIINIHYKKWQISFLLYIQNQK